MIDLTKIQSILFNHLAIEGIFVFKSSPVKYYTNFYKSKMTQVMCYLNIGGPPSKSYKF
jgi:hypothetical protein